MALDQFKREIRVGDIISYPGRQSSSIWNNIAVVKKLNVNGSLGVTRGPQYRWETNQNLRNTTVHMTQRAIILNKEDLATVKDNNIQNLLLMSIVYLNETK